MTSVLRLSFYWERTDRHKRYVAKQTEGQVDGQDSLANFNGFCTVHCNMITQHSATKFLTSNLIFNFCCLLRVSKLLGSSSGRRMYMQYGTSYVYSSLVDGTVCSGQSATHQNGHTDARTNIPSRTYNCLHDDEPKTFETRRRQQKLKIKFEFRNSVHFFGLCSIKY